MDETLKKQLEITACKVRLGKIKISEQICDRERSARMTRLCVEYSLEYSKTNLQAVISSCFFNVSSILFTSKKILFLQFFKNFIYDCGNKILLAGLLKDLIRNLFDLLCRI